VADVPLASPRGLEDVYLGRAEEVARGRPVLTGDVFEGVELDLEDHGGLVMVVAHPCSMRANLGRLRPRVVVAPIRRHQHLPFRSWPGRDFDFFPLPQLLGDTDDPRATNLRELSTARSETLATEHRVAALCNRGIHLLHQRLVHSLSRVVVGLDVLEEHSGHVLLEAELEEEWVEELAGEDAGPEERQGASEAFAAYLDAGLRVALLERDRRSDVAREVRAELRRRRA
jgi:hypothetical protein